MDGWMYYLNCYIYLLGLHIACIVRFLLHVLFTSCIL